MGLNKNSGVVDPLPPGVPLAPGNNNLKDLNNKAGVICGIKEVVEVDPKWAVAITLGVDPNGVDLRVTIMVPLTTLDLGVVAIMDLVITKGTLEARIGAVSDKKNCIFFPSTKNQLYLNTMCIMSSLHDYIVPYSDNLLQRI